MAEDQLGRRLWEDYQLSIRDREIERLRAALERARDALLVATDGDQYSEHMDILKAIDDALRNRLNG
jgi:hypothetical protein